MKDCGQTFCFQLSCNCAREGSAPTTSPCQQSNLEDIYSKFALTLEEQLRKQHEKYTAEIDGLSNEAFTLKNYILKLELRNQKDVETLAELRRQYNILLQQLREKEPRVIKEVQVVQKIKEVMVQVPSEELKRELALWKKKAEENTIQSKKERMQKQLIAESFEDLKGQIERLNKKIDKLQDESKEKDRSLDQKDRLIEKLNLQVVYLKSNKQVVVQTKHLFPEFKPVDRVRTEIKVQTIYVQKPVQRLVFVDVEKRVKQFIQPERAVVNRILACEAVKPNNCIEQQSYSYAYKSEINNLNSYIDQLEGNIASYKAERQGLVNTIDNKNSQLNFLEAKMRLFGGTNGPVRTSAGSTVNVTVSKTGDVKPTSQKSQPRLQKDGRRVR